MTNPNLQNRPYQVTFLGWLLIVVGIVSTAIHLWKVLLGPATSGYFQRPQP